MKVGTYLFDTRVLKEGIARAQRKLKVLVLYLFYRVDRYSYKGIKYALIFR